VGGHNKVAMSDLRDLLTGLGFTGVKSLVQSGNLVFTSNRGTGAGLERQLETETAKRLGVSADFIVRTATQWQEIIAANPFPQEAKSDPSHLLVMFLKTAPPAKNVELLAASIKGPETFRCDGKQLYIVYPVGIGRSKLTGTSIEQELAS